MKIYKIKRYYNHGVMKHKKTDLNKDRSGVPMKGHYWSTRIYKQNENL